MAARRDIAAVEADAPSPADAGDGELRFRVVRHEGWRKGIRLERLFWSVLGDAARASGETLASLVRRIAGEEADGNNATAQLRLAATRHLADEAESLRHALDPRRVVTAMQAAPVPSFAVTRDRRIYSCNREFMALLRANLVHGGEHRGLDTVRLSFDVPIPRLLDVLKQTDKDAVLCSFRVNADGSGFSGNARVRLAPAAGEPILVSYVMPAKTKAG